MRIIVRFIALGLTFALLMQWLFLHGFKSSNSLEPTAGGIFGILIGSSILGFIDIMTDDRAAVAMAFWLRKSKKSRGAPRIAGLILWVFSSAEARDAKLDDLNELFLANQEKHGYRTARNLFWWDCIRSLGPAFVDFTFRVAAGVMKLVSG